MYTPGMIRNFINDKVINKDNTLVLKIGGQSIEFTSREELCMFLDRLDSDTKVNDVIYCERY